MSPLSVVQASHYVKEEELGHSHFFRSAAYGNWARMWYGTKNVLKRKRALNPLTATTPILNFLGLPWAYIYARVEKRLYNRLFIGSYNLWLIRLLVQLFPEGSSSGFVHWFPVRYFLQPRIFTYQTRTPRLKYLPGSLPLQPCGRSYG